MKLRLIILSLLAAPLVTGCIKDDLSGCEPDNNVTLMFRYPDKAGIDCFQDRHENVVIALFDETSNCTHIRQLDKASLLAFQGAQFSLPAGTYQVVCWGNVSTRSLLNLSNGNSLAGSSLCLDNLTPKQSSDPIMYAPRPASKTKGMEAGDVFRITVPVKGEVEETIDFVSAHTRFNVIVRGLADKGEGINSPPDIEISELPADYNFEMKVQGGTVAYRKTSEYSTSSQGPEATASFYTGNFTEQDPVTIDIYSTVDGRLLETVYLPPYLAEKNIDFSTMLERSITVLIEFLDQVRVTVSISSWTDQGVHPEL